MVNHKPFILVIILLILEKGIDGARFPQINRQKRCIVVQKQSGTHGDSTEGADNGDDDDFKKPMNKDPHAPDKRWNTQQRDDNNIETLSSFPVKYKILPKFWLNRNLRLKQ